MDAARLWYLDVRKDNQRVSNSYSARLDETGKVVLVDDVNGAFRFDVGSQLGSGSFGQVYKLNVRGTDTYYSVKAVQTAPEYIDELFEPDGSLVEFLPDGDPIIPDDFVVSSILDACSETEPIVHARNVRTALVTFEGDHQSLMHMGNTVKQWKLEKPPPLHHKEDTCTVTFYQVMDLCIGDMADVKLQERYTAEADYNTRLGHMGNILGAIIHAFQCGNLLYTDVKSNNILLCSGGGGGLVPMLGDLGSFFKLGGLASTTYEVPWKYEYKRGRDKRMQLRTNADTAKLGFFIALVLYYVIVEPIPAVFGGTKNFVKMVRNNETLKRCLELANEMDSVAVSHAASDRYVGGMAIFYEAIHEIQAADAAPTEKMDVGARARAARWYRRRGGARR